MSKKNQIIAGGLNGLLNPNASDPEEQEPAKANKPTNKTVCYSIPVEVADKIRYISHYDRKTLGAVVAEALTAYIEAWRPTTEKPRKL
jgi:hypothetical protein